MATLRGAGIALLSLIAAAACSSSTGPGNGGPSGGHSTTITAVGSSAGSGGAYGSVQYYYSPTPDTVAAGSQITYSFQDVAHTVVFDGGPGGVADITATSNSNVQRTFTTAGTYTWHCSIHPYMHGTLVAK